MSTAGEHVNSTIVSVEVCLSEMFQSLLWNGENGVNSPCDGTDGTSGRCPMIPGTYPAISNPKCQMIRRWKIRE